MEESEEKLKSCLMRVKEESEKAGLKFNIQKTNILASSPITWWQIEGEKVVFPHSSVGKESACNAGDPGSIPGWGRSPGKGIGYPLQYSWASLVAQLVKNLPATWETWVQSLGQEDPPGEGKGYPRQYCGLENSMDCIVHGVTKSRTWLSDLHFTSLQLEVVIDFIFLGSKITRMVTAAMMLAPWKESYDKPRQCIKKQRHHFANKGL